MKKKIYLLNIDNFAPEVTKLTYPFIRLYAARIGAEIFIIKDRKFPTFPVTYEKLQIFELGKEHENDWNIYIDSDTLIHPVCPDFTNYLTKDKISFRDADNSVERFKADEYFYRDGRYFSPGNWFMIASDLCLDLWRPLEEPLEKILSNIFPIPNELENGITKEHLIDDYALAHNISRFGLHVKFFKEIYQEQGYKMEFLDHHYALSEGEKLLRLKNTIARWNAARTLEAWS
jgi:hypothetical protein